MFGIFVCSFFVCSAVVCNTLLHQFSVACVPLAVFFFFSSFSLGGRPGRGFLSCSPPPCLVLRSQARRFRRELACCALLFLPLSPSLRPPPLPPRRGRPPLLPVVSQSVFLSFLLFFLSFFIFVFLFFFFFLSFFFSFFSFLFLSSLSLSSLSLSQCLLSHQNLSD